jgi:uncharacterized repeat protein (TIGR01451 family)
MHFMKTSMLLSTLKGAGLLILLSRLFQGGPALAADGCGFAFVPQGTFSAGTLPQAVAVGDFNGDNHPDLVVANQLSGNVSVLLGNGNGTFQTAVHHGAGVGPVAVAVADLDGDNAADLIVANSQTDNVSVLLGNGNGTFQAVTNFPAGTGPSSVTVHDLNGDGQLDLAVANRASGEVSVLLGNGDGTFQSPVSYLAGIDPVSVVAADFNNDSRADLAVANAALFDVPPNISVLLGKQPNGTFQNAVDYEAGVSPRAVAAGDFNGDGRPDLVVANYGQTAGSTTTNSSVPVLLGAGDGTFSNAVHYLAGAGPLALAVADFNSDTNLDLVVANNRSNSLSVLPGNGNGTFQTAQHFNAGSRPRSVAVADFNTDGKPDLAVVNENGVLVLLNSCAELAVSMVDSPDPVGAGNNVNYTLTVTNAGPDPVADARLTDSLPAGLTFISATSSQGSCTNNNGTIQCELGLMTSAAQATVTIIAATTVVGPVTNTATMSSLTTAELNPSNNTATAITTVLPQLSIAATDPNASETGPDPGEFTVSRTGGTNGALTINYTVAGTASNGVDYAMLGGTVTIPDGAAAATLTVSPVDESAVEPVETVNLTLSPSPGYVINPAAGNATVSILDKDDHLLAINNAVVREGDAGTRSATFTVSLSHPHTQPVSVNFSTANGTAIAGADYVATNGIVNFPPGTTNRSIEVTVLGDLLNEADEGFFVNLSDPANGVITDGQGTGTIDNDDPVPSLSINDVMLKEGYSGSTNVALTVNLSAVSGQTVTVNFASANETATAGSDYVATNGTLTFPPGTTAQSFAVAVNGDSLGEFNETFLLNLSGAVNAAVSDGQGVVTIVNSEPALFINDAAVTEGDTATTNAVFTVSLSFAPLETVTVSFATASGTASADSDYAPTNGVVTFAAGTTNQAIAVEVVGDLLDEADETIFLNLSNPTNATLGGGQGVGTIVNDDPLPEISLNNSAVKEGDAGNTNAEFTVSLSAASGRSVSVSYATADSTATAGSDYVSIGGLVTFVPGATNQSVSVTVIGDLSPEVDETFFVNLSSPSNAVLGVSQGIGTISNDDLSLAIGINDVAVVEGNSGTTSVVFTVTLSSSSTLPVTVNYATADDTARWQDGDYERINNGQLLFDPGTTNRTISVTVNGDTSVETNETFFVNLSSPVNATLAKSQGVGTILNDEFDNDVSPPEITLSQLVGDDVLVSFTTAANRNYRLEHTEDFAGAPWTIAVNNIPGTGSVVTAVDVGGAGLPSRFYRVVLVTDPP